MRNTTKKILFILLFGLTVIQLKLKAQAGVGPCPYCLPTVNSTPCNQPNPSNNAANFINDFIDDFFTTGGTANITNIGSGCNTQFVTPPIPAVQNNYYKHPCVVTKYLQTTPGQALVCNFRSGIIFSQGFAVWVDWNNDAVFAAGEMVCCTPGSPPAATPAAANWVCPAVANGKYRMRVRCSFATAGCTIDPCNNQGFGEAEDYTVFVGPVIGCATPITATLSSNSPICAGQNLQLTSLYTGVSGPATFTWTGPNAFTSNVQNPLIPNAQVINSGVYNYTVSDPCGVKGFASINVTVNPTPTLTPTSNTPCVGSPLNFNVIVNPASVSYTWTGPNAFTSNVQNPVISPSTTNAIGQYTIQVTTAPQGCTNIAVMNVTVVPQPTVIPNSNTPICVGQTLSLFANPPATSYTWTGPNAFTSNSQNPSIAPVTALAAGNYTIKVTNGGCTNQAVTNVVINPLPTITVNNPSVCPGIGATLTGGGASTYTWNPGPIVGPSVTFTPPVTTVYTVSATSAFGCTAQTTATVVVNPLPAPLPGSNSPVCTGGSIALTVNAATSYTWTGPNAFTSNLQNPTITNASTLSAGNYTVMVTSALGCTAQAVVNVIVNPTPTISVGNPGPYCAGSAINLTVTAATSYTWTGPLAFTSNLQNPTIANSTTNMAGPYVVTVTAAGGCKSTGTVNVVVNGLPTPTATSNSPICLGKQINLFANPAASSYTWSGPNAFASNAQNPTIASAAAVNGGNYTVTVTNAAGCTNTSVVTVIINPLPVVAVTGATTCVGSTFTLTAATGTAFAWAGPNAFNTPVQNPSFANAQVTHSGNYTVVVTSALGCTNSAVANVSVIANPTMNIIGTNTLCSQNFNASVNTTTLTAGGGNSYVWTLPVGFSALPNLSSNPITLNPPVTSTSLVATMTVVGTAGSCTSQAVYQVTVYPNPTITVNSASMCAGTQVTLTASNATTYTWTPSATLNTPNGPSVIANPTVTTVYSIIGGSVGCNSQSQNATASVVPNPTVTVLPNPALICLNSSINLTASGATTYSWSPNIALTTTLGPNTTASPTITTTYSIIGSQATCTNLATIQVSVIGLPTVSIVGTNTLCSQNFNGSPNTTTLTASGAGTYVWTLPAGFSGSPSLSSNPLVITPPVTSVPIVATMTVLGTAGSCTSQAVIQVTVYPNPTITATSGSMCAGTQVTLTASNATTYTWTPSATLNTPNGPSVIANPTVTTVYSIIGGSVGCNSQSQNATASVVPNPTVTVLPNPAVICLNQAINLTASGATNYTWTPNIALTTTNVANTTANPTVTTTYSVIGEALTCTHVANITVSVLPLPTITIVPSSPTLCMNNFNGSPNTVSLTANGAASYTWGPIMGLTTNTLNGSMIIGTSNGAAIVTGTVIGANGTCTNIGTFTLNAIPNPTISTTSGSMCVGTSVNLTASNATTYTWTPSATLNTPNGPSVIASPAVTTVYSIIGGSVGCNSQTQNATASVVANPTVSIAPTTPTICFGNSINLTANGANNYTWSPNIAITSTVGNVVTVNPTVTTVYTIIGEAATCTNTAAQTVTVVPLPIITIALNSPTMCMNNYNGSVNQITVTASGGTSYNWTGFNGVAASSNVGSPIVVTAILNIPLGTGTVIGAVGNCTNGATFSVIAAPNPIISVPSVSVCQGKSVMLTASGAQTYQWSPPTNLNSVVGTTVMANPNNTAVYSVIGSSINCQSPTETTTVTVVANPVIVIAPVTPTICAGSAIGLTAFGANNYTWSPAVNINTLNGNFVIVTPTVTMNYIVVGEAATCTSVAVREVSVIPLPDLQAISDKTVICIGDKVTINANGALNYTWTPTFGLSSGTSNFVVASPTVSTLYTLIGTNGVCTKTITYGITVMTRPILNLMTTNKKICKGGSAMIIVSGCQGYLWHPTSDSTILASNTTTNTTSMVVTPTANMNYTITGFNSSGASACPFSKEILVEVVPTITPGVSFSATICEGNSTKLQAEGSNTYQWTPFDGLSNPNISQPYANPKSTTIYTVRVSDGGFCGETATVLVKVTPQPTVDAGPDMILNSDEPMFLNAKGTGTLTWVFGDNIICHVCPNSQVTATRSGVYHVQTTNEFGCTAIDDVWIEITNDYPIFVPNSFTPNYDGLNDVFLVYGEGIIKFEMSIYNRWNQKIFNSNDQKAGWDGEFKGELVKNDSYLYIINYTTYDNKKRQKIGYVVILKEDY